MPPMEDQGKDLEKANATVNLDSHTIGNAATPAIIQISPYLVELPVEIELQIPHVLGYLDEKIESDHSITLQNGGSLHLLPIAADDITTAESRTNSTEALSAAVSNDNQMRRKSVKSSTVIGLMHYISPNLFSSPDPYYTNTSAQQQTTQGHAPLFRARNDSVVFSATFPTLPSATIPLSATLPRPSLTSRPSVSASETPLSANSIPAHQRPSTSSRSDILFRTSTTSAAVANLASHSRNTILTPNPVPAQSATSYRIPLQTGEASSNSLNVRGSIIGLNRAATLTSLASLKVPMTATSPQTSNPTPLLLKLAPTLPPTNLNKDAGHLQKIEDRLYVHIDPKDAVFAMEAYSPSRFDEITVSINDKLRPIHQFKDGILYSQPRNLAYLVIIPFRLDLCTQSHHGKDGNDSIGMSSTIV